MRCANCPVVAAEYIFESEMLDEPIKIYECCFGDKAYHLGDHRCNKLPQRKDLVRTLSENQNEEVNI